jgi:hypothetical protein
MHIVAQELYQDIEMKKTTFLTYICYSKNNIFLVIGSLFRGWDWSHFLYLLFISVSNNCNTFLQIHVTMITVK